MKNVPTITPNQRREVRIKILSDYPFIKNFVDENPQFSSDLLSQVINAEHRLSRNYIRGKVKELFDFLKIKYQ